MRRLALSLAALAAAASSVPLQAQTGAAPEAEEAFKCAMWASYFSVEFQDQPEGTAFAYALNYFVGRYEGLTGHGIDEAVDEQLVTGTITDLGALTPLCSVRMEDYGTRIAEWGKALQAISERMPEDGQQS